MKGEMFLRSPQRHHKTAPINAEHTTVVPACPISPSQRACSFGSANSDRALYRRGQSSCFFEEVTRTAKHRTASTPESIPSCRRRFTLQLVAYGEIGKRSQIRSVDDRPARLGGSQRHFQPSLSGDNLLHKVVGNGFNTAGGNGHASMIGIDSVCNIGEEHHQHHTRQTSRV